VFGNRNTRDEPQTLEDARLVEFSPIR